MSQKQKLFNGDKVTEGVRLILEGLDVDLNDENFKDTPKRVAKSFRELCGGLYIGHEDKEKIFGRTFESPYQGMIVEGPITASGLCPHHLLPINMTCVIAYLPGQKKLGLSKLARAIKMYAAQPLMQESLSHQIVEDFDDYVHPGGVALYISGKHNCMSARGVNLPDCTTTTMDVRGFFETDVSIKTEFQRILELTLRNA